MARRLVQVFHLRMQRSLLRQKMLLRTMKAEVCDGLG